MNSVGDRIKQIRKYYKITQIDFAKRVLVSSSYISKVESGKEIPSEIFVKLIALEFNVSYEWLKDGTGDMNISNSTYDYFQRNVELAQNDKSFPYFLEAFLTVLKEQITPDNNAFKHDNINGILMELTNILDTSLNSNSKALLFEITADYIGELAELIDRLQNLDSKKDPTENVSNYYVSQTMKNLDRLVKNTRMLITQN